MGGQEIGGGVCELKALVCITITIRLIGIRYHYLLELSDNASVFNADYITEGHFCHGICLPENFASVDMPSMDLYLPFPSRTKLDYSVPLHIDTNLRYHIDEKKFPGLKSDSHVKQPALMIGDCVLASGNISPNRGETSSSDSPQPASIQTLDSHYLHDIEPFIAENFFEDITKGSGKDQNEILDADYQTFRRNANSSCTNRNVPEKGGKLHTQVINGTTRRKQLSSCQFHCSRKRKSTSPLRPSVKKICKSSRPANENRQHFTANLHKYRVDATKDAGVSSFTGQSCRLSPSCGHGNVSRVSECLKTTRHVLQKCQQTDAMFETSDLTRSGCCQFTDYRYFVEEGCSVVSDRDWRNCLHNGEYYTDKHRSPAEQGFPNMLGRCF